MPLDAKSVLPFLYGNLKLESVFNLAKISQLNFYPIKFKYSLHFIIFLSNNLYQNWHAVVIQ